MKKILIALPLVLIMILSMVPVFAEDTVDVKINGIKYFDNVKNGKEIKTIDTYTIKGVDPKVAADAKKLEALIKEDIKKNFSEPTLATKESFSWFYEVDKLQVLVDKKAMVAITEEDLQVGEAISAITTKIKSYVTLTLDSGLADTKKLTDKGLAKLNAKINELEGKDQIKALDLKLVAEDVTDDDAKAVRKIKKPVMTAAEHKDASAEVLVYPDRVTEPKEKEAPATCVKPCEFITIKAFDLSTNAFHPTLQFKYKTVENQIPEFSAAIEHMMKQIDDAGMQVLNNFDLTKQILLPATNDKCEIIINVIPAVIKIDVIHELFGCCTNSKGVVTRPPFPEKSFREENVWVPFIEFTTQRVINQVKAEEWATTRIQQVTGTEWVFEKATFMDKFNPGRYLTGKVYTIDGKEIGDITNVYDHRREIKVPTVIIQYRPVNCIAKDEEKVDNATVENNNNTTAPVTANGGANLPATGAKDVSAFFLSAVALLGLGIFFAKKH